MSSALILEGLLLGWSVAWPPGPINAEMIRRGLSGGFLRAWLLGLGACTGDFFWALLVALGAGALADVPGVRVGLGVVSVGLLLFLASTFAVGARNAWKSRASGIAAVQGKLDSARGSYVLGLTLALTGPWNITFWLAVIGRQATESLGLAQSLTLASAVVAGAIAWTLVLCSSVRFGARFATPLWDVFTRSATSILMVYFAAATAIRLLAENG